MEVIPVLSAIQAAQQDRVITQSEANMIMLMMLVLLVGMIEAMEV